MKAWQRLRPRDRRALVLGGSLLLSACMFTYGIQPYRRARAALRERVIEQRALLARGLAVLAEGRELPAALERATGALDEKRTRLLPGDDPLSATAALVGIVGDEARREGVQLEAIESRTAEPAGDRLVAVRIEIRGRADLEALLRWLAALETGPHLVRVEGLTVAQSDAGAVPDSNDTEALLLAAIIKGYVLPETP